MQGAARPTVIHLETIKTPEAVVAETGEWVGRVEIAGTRICPAVDTGAQHFQQAWVES